MIEKYEADNAKKKHQNNKRSSAICEVFFFSSAKHK